MSKLFESNFEIISELGKGGNGTVYHVKNKYDNVEYALKFLHNGSDEKKIRFMNEIEIILENYKDIEGIIPVIEYSKDKDNEIIETTKKTEKTIKHQYWYTMPIATPIMEYINKNNSQIDDIVKGIIELSDTLIKLHSKNISHRDIKPSNIYYYKNRYYLGDFGLVSIYGDNNNLTKSDKALGAIFTIAPEMKRNPKYADGKKADVFSLAKTMWMLFTGNELGFDGQYNIHDETHSLIYMKEFEKMHLVELNELLRISTDNNPNNRPDMETFKEILEKWLDTFNDENKIQLSNWNFISKYIFGDLAPDSSRWKNIDKIVEILNIVSQSPSYNHMLFSDRGGLDFIKAERANENDCIYIYDSAKGCSIIKPKCLYYEGFNDDFNWNYFLIELDDLERIHSDERDYEILVEDHPGNYVYIQYPQYGVYDYDKGNKLPEGYKVVNRYLKGKFLIVLKNGIYNSAPSTYDGRHGNMTNEMFRKYIETIIENSKIIHSQIINKEKNIPKEYIARELLNISHEDKSDKICKDENDINISLSDISKFVEKNYTNWNLENYLINNQNKNKIKFYFKLEIDIIQNLDLNNLLKEKTYPYICKNGYIKALKKDEIEDNVYFFYGDRKKAIELKYKLNDFIKDECKKNNLITKDNYYSYFSIKIKKCGIPTHLFTKEEIKDQIISADDRKENTIVIDEDGFFKVIDDITNKKSYPVAMRENFLAGNMYVGKYANIKDREIDSYYNMCLKGWLKYLKSGNRQVIDEEYFMFDYDNVENILEKIKKYYN
ncbi:protein kinase domain-containing protein [Brachyspira pilosicoli]|uniref:protein kinase domain-containing protein n=1 Tax=Brachyspira pilosicoli TaxID=52584 RepID=UPI003004EB16